MELSVRKTKKGKISIYADGEFRFSVPPEVWYSSHLYEGQSIEEEELSELKARGNSFLCFDSAVRMLSLRAHSEAELIRKLTVKYDRESAENAVSRLAQAGLIDDKKFAELFSAELYERRHYGKKRILSELLSRGIDKNTAENAVKALDINEESGIIKVMEKLHINEESSLKEKQRAVRRLMNMGYSYGEISKYISFYEDF